MLAPGGRIFGFIAKFLVTIVCFNAPTSTPVGRYLSVTQPNKMVMHWSFNPNYVQALALLLNFW